MQLTSHLLIDVIIRCPALAIPKQLNEYKQAATKQTAKIALKIITKTNNNE